MKLSNFASITAALFILGMASGSVYAAKGGNKNSGGDPSGGYIDAVFIVDSLDPPIPPVASNSADTKGQVVWYGQMDLSQFEGTWDSGGVCFHEGLRDGIIVIYPQSSKSPLNAELIFWFNAPLESDDSVTYLLTMQGQFDEPDNWPPSVDDPQTTITLNYWEFAAENRKAQQQDCAGSSDFPAGPWTVTVTRVP